MIKQKLIHMMTYQALPQQAQLELQVHNGLIQESTRKGKAKQDNFVREFHQEVNMQIEIILVSTFNSPPRSLTFLATFS